MVHRSLADLKLSCEKDGSPPGLANVKSNTKAMAFGNAVFGGLIGVGVDIASGAAFDYPDLVQVESLACFNWYWVTYPASGCYRVLQTGKNEYSLDATAAHQRYSYVVPQ